ncbi:hypothetical protein [Streptomyces sp. NPDC060002]|uniref:hypothetical protein n=1 Tax=Streptomyces sp. NPDC060002 TaxID=3347033 RepID=UPI0036BA3F8E
MTSHVEQAVAARIAAARAKAQQRQEQRAELGAARARGLDSRKVTKLRRLFCATCARLQGRGTYYRCPLGCGAAVCKKRAGCGNTHLRQCTNRPAPREDAS